MDSRTLADGRYVLIEEIGRGGMAVVWRGRDTRLGVERAIKLLDAPPRRRSASARDRFDRESRIMARLEHPNVVPVYDAGQDDGQMWLVMSLVDGGSVADRLSAAGGALPLTDAIAIGRAVLGALVAAHAAGIVHRDVKPQNVLIDSRDAARLTDFGIARLTDDDSGPTRTGAVLGTWAYMAPEQRTDAKRVDPRSDLYAVGVLLVAMLGGDPKQLLDAERFDATIGALPPAVRPFVVRCLRHRPEERFPTAQDALDALDAVARRLDPLASSTGSMAPAGTRWGWVAVPAVGFALGAGALAAVGVGVGVAGVGIGWSGWFGPEPPALQPAVDPPGDKLVDTAVAVDPVPAPGPDETVPAAAPAPAQPTEPAPTTRAATKRLGEPAPAPSPAPDAGPVPTPEPPPGSVPARLVVSREPHRFRIDDGPEGITPWSGRLAPGAHVVVLLDAEGMVVYRRQWKPEEQPNLCVEPGTWQPCPR